MESSAQLGVGAHGRIEPLFGQTVVIKYGGAAMEQVDLKEQFAKDVLLLRLVGMRPVIVHGGGPQIGAFMKRLGKEPHFVGGMRVTDAETMEIVEMVLAGSINKEIVGAISAHGGRAVGLCGADAGLIRADRRRHVLPDGREIDLGRVGDVKVVNPEPLELLQGYERCTTRYRRSVSRRPDGGLVMDDAAFVGITVGFFLLTWALIRLCERL